MNEELKKIFEQLLTKMQTAEEMSQDEIDLLTKLNAAQGAVKKEPDPEKKKEAVRKIAFTDDKPKGLRSIAQIVNLPARLLTDAERELQMFSDDAYIVSTILKTNPRNLKMWGAFEGQSSALKKALDTATAGEGAEWVPTILSAELIQKFRLESKVAGLFQDITMPSNPFDIPFMSGDIDFYYVGESVSDSAVASPTSTQTTGKQTLTAKKLKARVYFSDELTEDSIVPVLPILRADMGIAGADAIDDVLINGDLTATHMDSDVTDSKDRRKAWNGLRDLCPAGTKKDLSTFSYANHRTILKAMGKYGVQYPKLAIINSVTTQFNFEDLDEAKTVDKYGPKATILNGELAKIGGVPLIVSDKVRMDLNASGVYDDTTKTKTIYLVVHRAGFFLGTRGGVKLTFKEEGEVDQAQLIMRFRKAFTNRWTVSATVTTIGLGYNIT